MVKKFIEHFLKHMDIALAEKTNWGRNDLKLVIQTAISNALSDMVD